MQDARPSRTALRVALRRAAHQLYDARPLVLDDPIAVSILGDSYADELSRTPTRPDRPFSVALRAFLVARSRYAEDNLARAISQGVTQYVLLGAGLDTFAHRNPYLQLRVFEVDHPATQQWKRGLLENSRLPSPANLIYGPVDLECQSLPERLYSASPAWAKFPITAGLIRQMSRAYSAMVTAYICAFRAAEQSRGYLFGDVTVGVGKSASAVAATFRSRWHARRRTKRAPFSGGVEIRGRRWQGVRQYDSERHSASVRTT